MNSNLSTYQTATLAPEITMNNGASQPLSYSQPAPTELQEKAQASGFAEKFGGWVHKNQWFTKEPVTYLGYQFTRAAAASVPYGLAMAGVHHGMGMLGQWGIKHGFDVEKLALGFADMDQNTALFKGGNKAKVARSMARVAHSPFNAALQIAAAFTLYRFTGGIVKTIRDKVTNPANTEEQTVDEVRNIGKTIKDTAALNWPAESGSTPWAALTLGFMSANFKQSTPYERIKGRDGKPIESFGKAVKRVWSPQAKLLQNAAIWTLSYSAFFEIAERLFKDQQIKRGKWDGHHNSVKKSADTLTAPHAYEAQPTQDEPQPEQPKKNAWHSGITEDPSLGRLIFRRVLPVAVGISAYAAMKRVGYLAAGGQMKPIDAKLFAEGTKGQHTKRFFTNAWREGAATSMFFTLWAATDAMGDWFDKTFDAKPVAPTQKQQQNHDELLAKINEKMQSAGRAA